MATSLRALNRTSNLVTKKDLFSAPLDHIHVESGFNARDMERAEVQEHVQSIARTLLGGGTIPPLEVRVDQEGRIIVVDGHCRRAGALLAREMGAPIESLDLIQFKGDDADRVAKIATSSLGMALTPYELATVYKRLDGFGWDRKKIADRMGKSVEHVSNLLLIAYAPTSVQALIRDGKVSAQIALEKLKDCGDAAADILVNAADDAAKRGLKSVSRKSLGEKTFGRKVSASITSHFKTFQTRITQEQAQEYESLAEAPDESLTGRRVEIDALALAALLRAQRDAAAVYAEGAAALGPAGPADTKTLPLDLHLH